MRGSLGSKDKKVVLEINCDPNLKLPYIYLKEIDAKMMIDTGSMRSFFSPRIAHQYFEQFIEKEPFQVVSTHATSTHDETITIPLLPTFNSHNCHKFYIYDVDARYEGLIGNDLLQQMGAVIDLKNQILQTSTTCIPIINNNLNYVLDIAPRTEQRVKLPVNQHSGEAILDFKEFTSGVRMPTALINCFNGYASTVIQNTSEKPITLLLHSLFL